MYPLYFFFENDCRDKEYMLLCFATYLNDAVLVLNWFVIRDNAIYCLIANVSLSASCNTLDTLS